jgi:hypothetical protein
MNYLHDEDEKKDERGRIKTKQLDDKLPIDEKRR